MPRARGFFDCGFEFGLCVLINRGEASVANDVWPGLIDLDEIGALFELFANRGHDFGGIVGIGGIRQHVLRRVEMIGVFMSAENVDGVPADAQARSGHEALIDCVAHRSVGRSRAFGAHVALRREACHEVGPGCENGENRPLRDGLFHRLQVFGSRMQKQVHVGINQSWEQGAVTQIDGFRARGVGHL